MEISVPMTVAARVRPIVYGRFSETSCATEKLLVKELPKFQVRAWARKWRYCCQSGKVSPIFCRNSSSCSAVACSPSTAIAGSPGSRRMVTKTRVRTRNSVGMASAILMRMARNIGRPYALIVA